MEALNSSLRNNGSGGANNSLAGSAHKASFSDTLYTYALPITATVGTALNIALLAILRVSSLRSEITAIYVKAIAFSDLGFLVFSLFPWVQMVFQINVYHSVGFCQLVNFAMTVFPSLSLFFILSFAINGVIWKTRPWLRQDLPEAFGSKIMLVGIAFFAVYLQVYPFWFWESSSETSNQCTVHYENSLYFSAFLKFDMFLDIIVQVAFIALGVGYGLFCQKCARTKQATSICESTPSLPAHARNTYTDIYGVYFRQIFLVFLVSVVFFSLPTSAFVLARLCFPTIELHTWSDLIGLLFYVHFAVKPLGYITLSTEFRDIIKMAIQTFARKIHFLWNVDKSYVGEESERLHSNK